MSLPIRVHERWKTSLSIALNKRQSIGNLPPLNNNEQNILRVFFLQLSSLFTLEAVYFALVHSWKNKNELSIVDSVPRVSFLALKPICKDYKHIRSVV